MQPVAGIVHQGPTGDMKGLQAPGTMSPRRAPSMQTMANALPSQTSMQPVANIAPQGPTGDMNGLQAPETMSPRRAKELWQAQAMANGVPLTSPRRAPSTMQD